MKYDYLYGYNVDLLSQINLLNNIITKNVQVYSVISQAQTMGLNNYYIGGGCIAQTVWNYQVGNNDLMNGISDIDFVYYDDVDLSFETENLMVNKINSRFLNENIKIDIKNQARVHMWYKEHFGYDIQPYISVENSINTWPTTATAVGVRLEDDKLKVYAPFGLNDLFGMIVKPNKAQITKEIYELKVDKWKSKWPMLKVISW